MFRIGHGYDVHAFEEGKKLVLGGVEIKHSHGMKAHSDGDVVLHAVCDALLGAAALGDIGLHFPDTDERFRNADSRLLLAKVAALIQEQGYRVSNVDVTVIAQLPKLAPYIQTMQKYLADDLQINIRQVSIKATTAEHLGSIGRCEGIAVHATTLIYPV